MTPGSIPAGGGGLSHPFLRYRSDDRDILHAWADGDDRDAAAVVLLSAVDRGTHDDGRTRPDVLAAVGSPERLAELLRTVELDHRPAAVTLSRGTGALAADRLERWGLRLDRQGGIWDRFGVVDQPAGRSHGETSPHDVLELDLAADEADVRELLALANPGTTQGPDDPRAARSRWYGWRQPAERDSRRPALVAVGCATPTVSGAAVLGAIATHPDHRGRGLATAITARATSDSLRSHGVVILGVLAENHVARRLYTRLGFDVWHEAETWRQG